MTSSFRLRILTGTSAGATHLLQLQATVGRDETNHIQLTDPGISRRHCELSCRAGYLEILDLGSTNGIRVVRSGNSAVEPVRSGSVRLLPGDEVGIGTVRMRVECEMTEQASVGLPILPETDTARSSPAHLADESLASLSTVSVRVPPGPHRLPDIAESAAANSAPPHFIQAPDASHRDLPSGKPDGNMPKRVRNYVLSRKIGQGGMGEVYLALPSGDSPSPTPIAIKLLQAQRQEVQEHAARFLREMEISTKLRHPYIIQCTECGQEGDRLYIVMQYCNGGNLEELLERSGPLTVRRALRLMDRILAGVAYAHNQGIVHRDLKPSNILLHKTETGKYHPKVTDFGLAKNYLMAGTSGMTAVGTVGGSWAYMPKEQLTNFRFVSPQSDVWSLGAILYECLTAKLPRPTSTGEDPLQIVLQSKVIPITKPLPGIGSHIARVIMKSLAVDVVDRYKDAGQMRKALHVAAARDGLRLAE